MALHGQWDELAPCGNRGRPSQLKGQAGDSTDLLQLIRERRTGIFQRAIF